MQRLMKITNCVSTVGPTSEKSKSALQEGADHPPVPSGAAAGGTESEEAVMISGLRQEL
jgi:hypothetical protein